MKAVYIDASAVVKLVIDEPEHGDLEAYLLKQWLYVSSIVTKVEVRRAVARAQNPLDRTVDIRVDRVLTTLELMAIDSTVIQFAGGAQPISLRSLDAIHLGTALCLGGDLEAFITYDRKLGAAASASGLRVVTPGYE